MKVYALFELWGDGDGYVRPGLKSLHTTEKGAIIAAHNIPVDENWLRPLSEKFNKDNHYTVVDAIANYYGVDGYQLGGFVVSEFEVQE